MAGRVGGRVPEGRFHSSTINAESSESTLIPVTLVRLRGDGRPGRGLASNIMFVAEEERVHAHQACRRVSGEALRYVVTKKAGGARARIDILAVARDPWARIMRQGVGTR